MAILVPPIVRATAVSVTTYDFVDNLLGKTLNRKVVTNVATIKLDRDHKKNIGDMVYIMAVGGSGYNGTFKITAIPSSVEFSFALTHADEDVADLAGEVHDPLATKQNGYHVRSGANNIRYSLIGSAKGMIVRRSVTTNVVTITTRDRHGLKTGDQILIYGSSLAGMNNTLFTITGTPTPYTATFALTTSDGAAEDAATFNEVLTKTVAAQVYFQDPELVDRIFTTGTTATGIVIGYSPYTAR